MNLPIPLELVLRIITLVLDDTPRNPLSLLLVHPVFLSLSLSVLHTELRFSSVRQLEAFKRDCDSLAYPPRVPAVALAGGTADYRLFKFLHSAVGHILDIMPSPRPNKRRLSLRRIQFCLNSHMFDPNCGYLHQALSIMDPEEFVWTGPDPAHHFSIAIVPEAVTHLLRALQTWTNLRYLKLTNLSLPPLPDRRHALPFARALGVVGIESPHPPDETVTSDSQTCQSSDLVKPLSHLRTVYLGQITFLNPAEIATIACAPELSSLTSVQVVDAYEGSIWGPRIRYADIERAIATLPPCHPCELCEPKIVSREHIQRARMLVSCEALTERIIGGDRMDYVTSIS
ncbi:hypothetical protein M0805_000186 [Coniferiporia weirii]|nr:hypothetical protein M0805_000186 [Coniferiporia weirii]